MSEKRDLEDVEEGDECIGPMPDDNPAKKKAKGQDVFCTCKGIETDKMIFCENKNCPIGWYHYECAGLTEDTIPWGIWICKSCKQKTVLDFEELYLLNLPSSEAYEKSYMHRDVVTHVAVTKKDFILTASCDGHVKFWRKNEEDGIEFVKHFRSHLGSIEDMAVSNNGELGCTVSDDKSAKIFDIINFDMINMLKLSYAPGCCGWLFNSGDAKCAIAVAEKNTQKIHIYDGRGNSKPIYLLENLHYKPVIQIKYSPVADIVVSADVGGMVEFWTGPKGDYGYAKGMNWQYKTDTDLYDFVKCHCYPTGICFSPDGNKIATIATDRKIRIFKLVTGKLIKVLDESLQQLKDLQQMKQMLSNMEFGRRLAVEKELEKSDAFRFCNILYDETGYFLLYGTMLGVKVINIKTNRCLKILGKPENPRFLNIALFQGSGKKAKAAPDVNSTASDNPILQTSELDPILFCTAFRKNRFYLFSRREPFDTKSHDSERDIFNEKPSKEEQAAATQDVSYTRLSENCTIHTTMGDIHCKLFTKECPKTVENFCVHSKNGYYNGHLVHRVIKGFMIQTGDPLGNGTGGESIWGGEFEDEFHPGLRHDRPYTLSMANAGPNTNGSQFFITVVPTPWLDNKHTVFGRVVKGMEVVHNISVVKTNPKTDKPLDDIRIVNITVK